jgi:hypothetical protein
MLASLRQLFLYLLMAKLSLDLIAVEAYGKVDLFRHIFLSLQQMNSRWP